MRCTRSRFQAVLPAILFLAWGCRGAPEAQGPLTAPSVRVRTWEFPGDPLGMSLRLGASGASGKPAPQVLTGLGAGVTDRALQVTVELIALERHSGGSLEPLGSRARLITTVQGSLPFLPTTRLLSGVRVGFPEDAEPLRKGIEAGDLGRSVVLGTWGGMARAGSTWGLEVGDAAEGIGLPDGTKTWRHVKFLVHRPGGAQGAGGGLQSVQVSVAIEDADLPEPVFKEPGEPAPGEPAPGEPGRTAPAAKSAILVVGSGGFQKESALLDGPSVDRAGWTVILVPFLFAGGESASMAAIIRTNPAPAEAGSTAAEGAAVEGAAVEDAAATAQCIAHKDGAISTSTSPAGPGAAVAPNAPAIQDPAGMAMESALGSLRSTFLQRRTVSFLARESGARLCEDLALTADDGAMAILSKKILQAASSERPERGPSSRIGMGFLLESCAYRFMAELLGGNGAPAELMAVLAVHAGAVGRDPSSIEETVRSAADLADLHQRLIEENRIFLMDASPPARVRAFEWLQARKLAPPGFDPLAGPKERREALKAAVLAAEGARAQGGSQ